MQKDKKKAGKTGKATKAEDENTSSANDKASSSTSDTSGSAKAPEKDKKPEKKSSGSSEGTVLVKLTTGQYVGKEGTHRLGDEFQLPIGKAQTLQSRGEVRILTK